MSNLRRPTGALCGALVALSLVGCASETPTGSALPGLPPSCGEFTLDQGETIPDEAVECMAEAGAGGATLTVTFPTVEGDPILTVYTSRADGSIEVFTDMTEDRWGGGTSLVLCPEPVSVLELGVCVEQPVE